MHAINKNLFGRTFFHLGPPRDTSVFQKLEIIKPILNLVILFYVQAYLTITIMI